MTASRITVGTNMELTLSTTRCTGALELWARRTEAMMRASSVAAPTRRARTVSDPLLQSVPAVTSEPLVFSTGIGSPESMLSSTAAVPSVTVPSTGMRSPGRTSRRSSGRMSAIGTGREVPSEFSSIASVGCRPIRARNASPVCRLLRASIYLPVSTKAMIMAAPS